MSRYDNDSSRGSRSKRAPMGEAVGELADVAIVTSDNPRDEDPGQIAEDLLAGLRKTSRARFWAQLDRRQAIAAALDEATPADVIVIAGKGHERGQIVGREVLEFCDADEVARALGRAPGPKDQEGE